MSYFHKENEIKLDILHSLSRSQRALAVIMEGLAEHAANKETVENLIQHMDVLAKYQIALSAKIANMELRMVYRTQPLKPWINPKLSPDRSFKRKR